MFKERISTVEEALAYITECNLATVEMLALRKKPPVGEFRRQISIAQTAIDWMVAMNVYIPTENRAFNVVNHFNSSVHDWANKHRN